MHKNRKLALHVELSQNTTRAAHYPDFVPTRFGRVYTTITQAGKTYDMLLWTFFLFAVCISASCAITTPIIVTGGKERPSETLPLSMLSILLFQHQNCVYQDCFQGVSLFLSTVGESGGEQILYQQQPVPIPPKTDDTDVQSALNLQGK